MFTGLITDIGEVISASNGRFQIGTAYELDDTAMGASIACDGCCLTVVAFEPGSKSFNTIFSVDVSNETLSRTTLRGWEAGRKINLERSLTPTTELGGHIVSGHVDGVANISERRSDGSSERFVIEVKKEFARFIAPKGSVALNGVSLTVNDVDGSHFGINLVPHTLSETTWSQIQTGDQVNLEVDLLARYVARITEAERMNP